MRITFNVGWWIDVKRDGEDIILLTADDNGNEMEIVIKDGWLNKRRIKQFTKDLNELNGESK